MTPDNERQAWREAVRAFRLAATALKNPAPALFADLSVEECLRDLTQEPPLVSFSPFDALPDGAPADPNEHLPGSGSGRAPDPITERGTTPTGAGWTSGPRSPQNLPGAAPHQDNEPAVRPPAFSFRRSGPAAQPQTSQPNQDISGDSTEKAESKARAGRFRVPEPAPEGPRQEAPVAVDARFDPPGAVRLEADDHTPGEHGSAHPMALLNNLADEALEAVGRRAPDVNVRPSNISSPQPLPPGKQVIRSPEEPGHEVYGHDAGSAREADDHAPAEHGSPRPVAPPNGPAGGFPEAAGGRAQDLLVPGSGDLPEPGREAYGNSAIALIDSLAEHLLPPQVRIVGDSPGLGENTPGVVASTASDRSAFAFLDSVHEEPAGELTFDPKPSDTDKEAPGVASDRYMDAETFASLVNDVLVEQARRHGVDLS